MSSTKVQSYAGQWNVQVVRGKVTTRCLWNACRALAVGIVLLLIGTSMAVIGYYAEQLSEGDETRGNATIHVKYESRGFHLNNLSYAGPIVMGIGGFIVVAACVMTFEARDSAAKVVPARYKPSTAPSSTRSTPRTTRPSTRRCDKKAAGCQTRQDVSAQTSRRLEDGVTRSPSAPSLADGKREYSSKTLPCGALSLLSPHLLPRQAVSMDCHDIGTPNSYTAVMDWQKWQKTLSAQEEVRKKRLMRQRQIDDADHKTRREQHQPLRRCVSTNTQTSVASQKSICCVHTCPGGVIPMQLKRHCSVGGQVNRRSTALHSPQKQTCSIIAAPCIAGHRCVSPDFAPQRRPSRASCPSPRRERSPSPSCSRKTSLPSSGAEPV